MKDHKSPGTTNTLISILLAALLIGPLIFMFLFADFNLLEKTFRKYANFIAAFFLLLYLSGSVFLVLRIRRKMHLADVVIMERLQIEKELKESQQRLMDIINFLPDATFVIDNDKKVIIWNHAMEELTGIKEGEMVGKGDYEYALPFYDERRPILIDLCLDADDMDQIKKYYPEIRKKNKSFEADQIVPGTVKKGAYLWGIAQPLYDSFGNRIGAIESLKDVTERKLSQEKYATIFRLSPFVLSISSVSDGKYLEVSDRFSELTGYANEEVIGRTAFDLNIWADANDRERILELLRTNGRVINDEVSFRSKSGEIRTMFFSAEIVTISGKPCLLAVNVDITDKKIQQETIKRQNDELLASNEEFEALNEDLIESQEELSSAHELLRQSEEMLSAAYHLAPVSMTLSRMRDGHYVEVSDNFLHVTEYSREEVIGSNDIDLNVWTDIKDRDMVVETVREHGVISDCEIIFQSRSGKKFTMLFSAQRINVGGEPHLASVAKDITDHKRSLEEKHYLEEQLLQAQKLESIGRLAGGVAHDFNNLLTAIIGNADLALRETRENEKIKSRLEVVKAAGISASQLTRQLLAFSRKEAIEPIVIGLKEVIEGAHKILARLIGEDIDLRISINSDWYIKADPGQIEQIIINLSVNARDAMPDGGLLSIKTEDISLDEYYSQSHTNVEPGEYVMVSVTDSGIGITDEMKKSLFEPFYTTKEKGHGTGLGLAMVYGAIKQNNGHIEVYSVPGEGSTFKVYFPREYDSPGQGSKKIEIDEISEGTETILLVEDDKLVRDYASLLLEKLGYVILQASCGEDAVTIVNNRSETIHMLLTDVILPGMNGKMLADTVHSLRPDIKILFTSGYTEDIIAYRGIIEKGINFISKPYTENTLAIKVRKILDA